MEDNKNCRVCLFKHHKENQGEYPCNICTRNESIIEGQITVILSLNHFKDYFSFE